MIKSSRKYDINNVNNYFFLILHRELNVERRQLIGKNFILFINILFSQFVESSGQKRTRRRVQLTNQIEQQEKVNQIIDYLTVCLLEPF